VTLFVRTVEGSMLDVHRCVLLTVEPWPQDGQTPEVHSLIGYLDATEEVGYVLAQGSRVDMLRQLNDIAARANATEPHWHQP
jgi:hypothetical protein